jgi:hypothetical protein
MSKDTAVRFDPDKASALRTITNKDTGGSRVISHFRVADETISRSATSWPAHEALLDRGNIARLATADSLLSK